MKKNQNFITIIILYLLLFTNSSCNKPKSYIKNKALEKQIEVFIKNAKTFVPSNKEKPETITLVFNKIENYYSVDFMYVLDIESPNLFAIIENENRTVFIISDTDISKFIYTDKPFKTINSKYKTNKKDFVAIIDWYSDFQYFDGQNFSRKESDMKK